MPSTRKDEPLTIMSRAAVVRRVRVTTASLVVAAVLGAGSIGVAVVTEIPGTTSKVVASTSITVTPSSSTTTGSKPRSTA